MKYNKVKINFCQNYIIYEILKYLKYLSSSTKFKINRIIIKK